MKFDLNDILIEPEIITSINSRSEINPYYKNDMLPIFTAPMDTVVNEVNKHVFIENKINAIIPRNLNLEAYSNNEFCFYSYGLEDFKRLFLDINAIETDTENNKLYVLLDVANGHMRKVIDYSIEAKKKYGDKLILMIGNVAHPKTVDLITRNTSVDYIRIGIGNGAGCLTTENVGVGYPMGSLISESREIIKDYRGRELPKLVADGGMKGYADIIKSLVLGADYVMCGSIFNKALESASENYLKVGFLYQKEENLKEHLIKNHIQNGNLYKMFRGMSTKEVQKNWNKEDIRTSEGISKYQKIEYTLGSWVENFTDYLKSAMSYTNSNNLKEFIGNCKWNLISENSFKRFNK